MDSWKRPTLMTSITISQWWVRLRLRRIFPPQQTSRQLLSIYLHQSLLSMNKDSTKLVDSWLPWETRLEDYSHIRNHLPPLLLWIKGWIIRELVLLPISHKHRNLTQWVIAGWEEATQQHNLSTNLSLTSISILTQKVILISFNVFSRHDWEHLEMFWKNSQR